MDGRSLVIGPLNPEIGEGSDLFSFRQTLQRSCVTQANFIYGKAGSSAKPLSSADDDIAEKSLFA